MRHSNSILPILLSLLLIVTACNPGKKAANAKKQEKTHTLASPAGKFELRPPASMLRMGHDSVAWSGAMPHSEDNGVIAYFFAEGASIALVSPQVRVEYISKNMPGAGSADKLFDWLKGLFLTDNYQGKLISDQETVTTASGQSVRLLEIQTPTTKKPDDPQTQRTGKNMIWAYIDKGDYLIGLSGTAPEPADYTKLKKDFLQILTSYSDE